MAGRIALLAVGALAVVLLAFWLLQGSTDLAVVDGSGPTPTTLGGPSSDIADASPEGIDPTRSRDPLARAQADLEAARVARAEAAEAVAAAGRELDDLEREIEAVEQFVENIEERGEDPARYAFEGMEQLDPVIERYEARLAALVAAEEGLAAADARLALAENALGDARGEGR